MSDDEKFNHDKIKTIVRRSYLILCKNQTKNKNIEEIMNVIREELRDEN